MNDNDILGRLSLENINLYKITKKEKQLIESDSKFFKELGLENVDLINSSKRDNKTVAEYSKENEEKKSRRWE